MGALAWESGPGDPHLFLPPPLPPPPLPWRHVWNHSKPYTPEKTILCLNSVSWPLRLRVRKSHPPQSAFHQRVSPTLLLIDLSAFYPPAHSSCLFLNSHHSLSAVGLVFWAWSYCCGHLHPLCPPHRHPASFFLVSSYHRCWLTRLGLFELNWITNNAINISIFIFALPTLSPLLTNSPFLSLRAWHSSKNYIGAEVDICTHVIFLPLGNECFLFFLVAQGSNIVSIIYYAHRHPYSYCVTAPAAVPLLGSKMNCRQGTGPWSDFWNSSSEKTCFSLNFLLHPHWIVEAWAGIHIKHRPHKILPVKTITCKGCTINAKNLFLPRPLHTDNYINFIIYRYRYQLRTWNFGS